MSQIAYINVAERGHSDQILFAAAGRLQLAGIRLAGVVQTNDVWHPDRACDMNLHLLGGRLPLLRRRIRISERLGAEAEGCRLDTGALEEAVGLCEADLDAAEILIVNKFGKREKEGGGFRPLIAEALSREIPVLTAAGPLDEPGLLAFAGEFAARLAPEEIDDWAHLRTGRLPPRPGPHAQSWTF